MIKNTFLACAIIAVIGAAAKHFLNAAGGEKASKIVQLIIGIILLAVFFNALSGIEIPKINVIGTVGEEYYENISRDAMEEIYLSAEEMAANELKTKIADRFGKEPILCKVIIDREKLEFRSIEIYFSSDGTVISAYEVKKYISDTYGIGAEVIFS